MRDVARLGKLLEKEGIPFRSDVPIAPYTTFRIGGPVACLIEPCREEEMVSALRACRACEVPAVVLGRGSNVLFFDEPMPCAVIRTGALDHFELGGHTLVAESGASLGEMVRAAGHAALDGLVFAAGIPGTLGGALYMNAGAYGREMADVVRRVRVYDSLQDEIFQLSAADMAFSYRHSALMSHPEWVVLGAELTLVEGDTADIFARMRADMQKRRDKQPLEYPSAGSTFKRPEGAFAGALIEQCGLKGYRIGGAQVSPKHAGFIVNVGGATARDVLQLIEYVRAVVEKQTGILLEPEVQIFTSLYAKR